MSKYLVYTFQNSISVGLFDFNDLQSVSRDMRSVLILQVDGQQIEKVELHQRFETDRISPVSVCR